MTKLRKLLLEQKFEDSCAMLYFNFPELKNIQKKIDNDDLYTEEGDRTYGLEKDPHITLLLGLHEDVPFEDIKKVIQHFEYPHLTAYNVSIFENEKFDVLKFDIKAPGKILHKVNKVLCKFPFTNDHPEYHPHVTIGYLKPGTVKKYVKLFKGEKFELIPKYAVYSEPPEKKTKIKIKVNEE